MKEPWRIVEAEFVAGASRHDQLPGQIGVELAFAGRSNVGKSSLLNAVMSRKNLVRTSSTPGCTRQINFFKARARDDATFQLVDLPGYGYAKRSREERGVWAELIERYLLEREWLRAVVVLIDARRGVEEDDRQLLELLQERKAPTTLITVATKIDKVPKSKRRAALQKIGAIEGGVAIGVSAITGEGIEALWQALRKAARVPVADDNPL